MTDFGHIGLNEVALGIPVPLYWTKLMGRVIGDGPAHKLCLTATLVSPQKALQLGLVDEVSGSGERSFMQRMLHSSKDLYQDGVLGCCGHQQQSLRSSSHGGYLKASHSKVEGFER